MSMWFPLPSSPGFTSWRPPGPVTRLRIIYNNDTHEHWDDFSRSITGFQALSNLAQASGSDVLRLNGGDNSTSIEPQEWELSIRLMNRLGLHGTTLGNHECYLPSETLFAKLYQWAQFPVLVSNIVLKRLSSWAPILTRGKINTNAQVIRTPQGHYGLLGVTSTRKAKDKYNTRDFSILDFSETCQKLQNEVTHLKHMGINRVILVSHLGYAWDRKLAQSVSGIDVIVGGDSHDAIEGIVPGQNLLSSPSGEPVLIVQSGANCQFVGAVDLLFDSAGRIRPLQNHLMPSRLFLPDPIANSLIQQYIPPARRLGLVSAPMSKSQLTRWLCETLRVKSNTDIALIRPHEIRKPLSPGVLTDWDVKTMMPYPDPMVCLTLRGNELLLLAQRMSRYAQKNNNKRLFYSSGLAIYTNSITGIGTSRVFNSKSQQWERIDPNKTYRIAMGLYGVTHAQAFPELGHPERIYHTLNLPLMGLFSQALQALGAPFRPVNLR